MTIGPISHQGGSFDAGGPEEVAATPPAAPASGPGSPAAVADQFYRAFRVQDAGAMEKLYAPGVKFEDPIFTYHDRAGTMGMWRNLFGRNAPPKISYRLDGVEGDVAKVHWVADYKIGGRPVHNEVDSRLTVRDGKIVDQRDSFSWEKWAAQAFPLGKFSSLPAVRFAITELLRGVAMLPPPKPKP